MARKATITSLALTLALLLSAVLASAASAGPVWKFDGKELTGTETILGGTVKSSFTMPGLTTTCTFLYITKIKNSGGVGKGETTYAPLFDCFTDSPVCDVETSAAEGLPWFSQLTSVKPSNFLVIDEIEIALVYDGVECVLDGTLVAIEGSAGGVYNNEKETITFNSATLETTKTKLEALGAAVEWKSVFNAEAFGPHLDEALTVG